MSPALYSTMHIAQVALLFECAAGGDSSIAVAAGDAAGADNGDTALFDLVESGGDDNTS